MRAHPFCLFFFLHPFCYRISINSTNDQFLTLVPPYHHQVRTKKSEILVYPCYVCDFQAQRMYSPLLHYKYYQEEKHMDTPAHLFGVCQHSAALGRAPNYAHR